MIIHKNPVSIEIGSVIPEDRVGYEDVCEIDDDSELAKKVLKHAPYLELVLDGSGNLIDVTPTERPPEPPQPPTPEERLVAVEDALLLLLLEV